MLVSGRDDILRAAAHGPLRGREEDVLPRPRPQQSGRHAEEPRQREKDEDHLRYVKLFYLT